MRNVIPLALAAAGIVALSTTGFLSASPNRVLPGVPIPIARLADPLSLFLLALDVVALAACGLARPSRILLTCQACLLIAAFLGLLGIAGHGADVLAVGKPPGARTSLAAGFWLSMVALALMAVDLAQEVRLGPLGKILSIAICLGGVVGLARSGLLDRISLMREFRVHADTFRAEFLRHLGIAMASVSIAAALGMPAGALAARRPAFGRRLLGVLGIVQTVPSIALFGLLIAPLSGLAAMVPALGAIGISGIGATPAVVALVLYGLLPIVRNTATAIDGVPAAVVDAATGIGMRPRQVLFRVRVPLAMPVILSGLRIVVTQTVGLTVVAALIGAGGLGTFVFLGLGQNAVDLIMLGVIPTVAMALVADALMSIVIARVGPSS